MANTDNKGVDDIPATRFETEAQPEEFTPTDNDEVANLRAELEAANQALQESEEKVASHWQRLLRNEADAQNTRRRAEQDVENARKFALDRFGGDLLQVLDSFDQGLSYAQSNQPTIKDLIHGMELTHTVLLNTLERQGITLIKAAAGDVFDPNFHEAISMQETQDMEPNRIVTVVQNGYMLHSRLLRAARVVVSKAMPA